MIAGKPAGFEHRSASQQRRPGSRCWRGIETGAPEALLFVNGIARGMFDPNHPVRLLTMNAVAKEVLTIHLEAYAGHSYPGTQPYPKDGALDDPGVQVLPGCRKIGRAESLTERPDVSAFVFELRALHQLAAGFG